MIESGNEIHLRVNVTKTQYTYEDTIYVVYAKYSSEGRILENDIITIWGNANDLISYQSVLGQKITIPRVDARIVQVNN